MTPISKKRRNRRYVLWAHRSGLRSFVSLNRQTSGFLESGFCCVATSSISIRTIAF